MIFFFVAFLADILSKYDKLFICANFDIHVCCPSDKLATDFKTLLMWQSTVLSLCLPLIVHPSYLAERISLWPTQNLRSKCQNRTQNVDKTNAPSWATPLILLSHSGCQSPTKRLLKLQSQIISLLFLNWQTPTQVSKSLVLSSQRRIITPSTLTFNYRYLNDLVSPVCPENFLYTFHSTCTGILDFIAPFKPKICIAKNRSEVGWHHPRHQATLQAGERQMEEGQTARVPGNIKRLPYWQSESCARKQNVSTSLILFPAAAIVPRCYFTQLMLLIIHALLLWLMSQLQLRLLPQLILLCSTSLNWFLSPLSVM